MKRSTSTIIAFTFTILLVLAAGIYPFIGSDSRFDSGSQFTGTSPQGIPSNGFNGIPSQGLGEQPPDGMPENRPNVHNNMPTGSIAGFRLLQILRLVAAGLITIFGGIAAAGLWLRKGWGTVLAVLSAMIALGVSVPDLFRTPNWSASILPIAQGLFGVLVLVFALLARNKQEPKTTTT